MKKANYNDDFIRTKENKETENSINEESNDSDFEINTTNEFFNNLSLNHLNSIQKKAKHALQLDNSKYDDSTLKQSTLEEKIQKISFKKNRRSQKFAENTPLETNDKENSQSPKLTQDSDQEELKFKPKKTKKQTKLDTKIETKTKVKIEDTTNTFQNLNLIKPLLKACDDLGYTEPTHIQKLAIPPILLGKDVLASSLTGSGKTAAFLLPILQKYYKTSYANYSKVLIVIPTRELAVQCYEMLQDLNPYTRISSCLIIGAVPIQKQEAELRRYPDIIIATPGRLIDLVKNSQNIDLSDIEIIVFDEADKLLELGYFPIFFAIIKNFFLKKYSYYFII